MSDRNIRRAAAQQARKQARKDARSTTSQPQIDANRANAQSSTGPKTDEGKANSSQNRRYHGLAGGFVVMLWEDGEVFVKLREDLRTHYSPVDLVEQGYVDRLAEHTWLRKRCLDLQAGCFDGRHIEDEKQFALLARYQRENENRIDKCVNMLLKLRAARQKEQNGFESEIRKTQAHVARIRLSNARAQHIEIRQAIKSPLPGNVPIRFEELSAGSSQEIKEPGIAA